MTAVEWLDRWFRDNPEATHKEGNEALQQAKEMEKQQIIDAQMDMFHYLNDAPYGMEYLSKLDTVIEFCKTYGSKVSDEHIVDTNEMIDHIGDANKMVEISDEEIEKWVASTPYYGHCTPEYKEGLDEGAKWYREQLKMSSPKTSDN